MDAANNPPREEQKAYNDDAMAEKMKKQLSENGAEADREEDAGEPVVDYRGWKAMPYVIDYPFDWALAEGLGKSAETRTERVYAG